MHKDPSTNMGTYNMYLHDHSFIPRYHTLPFKIKLQKVSHISNSIKTQSKFQICRTKSRVYEYFYKLPIGGYSTATQPGCPLVPVVFQSIATKKKNCDPISILVDVLFTQHAAGDGESERGSACHPPARGEIGQLCS